MVYNKFIMNERMRKTASAYSAESAEFRGELEKVYAKILGGRLVGGYRDGGTDVILDDNTELPFVQVKSSWPIAEEFLGESIRRNEFIPIVIGDPGQHTKDEIIACVVENGGFAGLDVPNPKRIVAGIKIVRDGILNNGGRLKELPEDKKRR